MGSAGLLLLRRPLVAPLDRYGASALICSKKGPGTGSARASQRTARDPKAGAPDRWLRVRIVIAAGRRFGPVAC
jgi:hypothetical protein